MAGRTRGRTPGNEGRTPTAGWTTRRWLSTGVAAALVVLLALGVAGGWVLARSSTLSGRVIDVDTPALVAAVRLESALTDQETGVRGYGLAGQPTFLSPYHTGADNQRKYTGQLRALIGGNRAAVADLDELDRRMEQWQQRVGRPVATAPSGAPVALAAQRADEGKRDFDRVREAAAHLQQTLQLHRDHSRADLRSIGVLRNWIFVLIAGVILALTAAVFAGLRRGVTRPLEHLSSDVRLVAAGRFDHPVDPMGPADLRQLAADVESMRGRLVHELEFTDSARLQLDEQATELRRSNAELEQFAYVASHDLQEPLRKVASFCQLLQRRYAEQLDDRAGQYIGFAVDGANRMQTLINDLLAFSRVGRLHTESSSVDLEALFKRTADVLSIAAEDSGTELSHDPLPEVTGDPTQLGMLFQNLLSNAIKFRSPDRTPQVRLTAGYDEDDGLWHFAVVDNGIGISPEFAEQVFVIFQRLHTRESYPGNGIGLALCKKIVEFHGGTIGIDPEHSPGTRITFTLPGSAPTAVAAVAEETQR
ncbi:sensor histidine kinase [Streptomyces sp. NBC_01477]|uniref:sensor histidine kinase n=1 Tax=Streptomyces sp. NBC_01477 TaxID=2976015 RepID=UPI002E2FCB31|nr:ATP-binding protein [Streptomyces sp. NBC_01477]